MDLDASTTPAVAPNSTTALDRALCILLGALPDADHLLPQLTIVASATLIVAVGAHGALRRPPSAAPPSPSGGGRGAKLRRRGLKGGAADGSDDDDDDRFVEGLLPSDALLYPLVAGCLLVALYYVIQYWGAELLNKILVFYFVPVSLASVGKLGADAADVALQLAFPGLWRTWRGEVLVLDAAARGWRRAVDKDGEGFVMDLDGNPVGELVEGLRTPFAGPLSRVSPSQGVTTFLWNARHVLMEPWAVRLKVLGVEDAHFPLYVKDIVGGVFAVAVGLGYILTKSDDVSNIMSAGLCYGAFMLLSPTTFLTASMVLSGLFVYDIVMVFYTPYMASVATKLEAPIKLVSRSKRGSSLLGLGDIVVPGILICLALRFDLYMFYKRKITSVEKLLEKEVDVGGGQTLKSSTKALLPEKAPFVDVREHWGDRFWTLRWAPWRPRGGPADAVPTVAATTFPKPYFAACVVGYAAGLLAALVMVNAFRQAQPALLYLVPAVVGAAWLAGLVRGEVADMLAYTEDGSLDTADVVVTTDGQGNKVAPNEAAGGGPVVAGPARKEEEVQGQIAEPSKGGQDKGYDLLRFSVVVPPYPNAKMD